MQLDMTSPERGKQIFGMLSEALEKSAQEARETPEDVGDQADHTKPE
jgi:hypothetical protein